jgi:Tfp pilus assembly protein PilN
MRAVNLLPESERQGRPPVVTTTSVVIGGAVVLGVVWITLGVLFFQSHGHVSHREKQLFALQQQIAQVQAENAAKAAKASTTAANTQGRVAAFDTASSARLNWDNLLDDISHVLPTGSWVSSLSMQAATPTPITTTTPTATAAPPTAFTVTGVAFSQDIVAQVMKRLALIPQLSNITLQTSSRADVGTTKAYTFTMSANINAPEVAQ